MKLYRWLAAWYWRIAWAASWWWFCEQLRRQSKDRDLTVPVRGAWYVLTDKGYRQAIVSIARSVVVKGGKVTVTWTA